MSNVLGMARELYEILRHEYSMDQVVRRYHAERAGDIVMALESVEATPTPVIEITDEMVDPSFPEALTDSEVRIWIANCNHEPARQALRQLLAYRVRGVSAALTAALNNKA